MKKKRKFCVLSVIVLFSLAIVFSSVYAEVDSVKERAKEIVSEMSLSEKAAQMIITVPERWSAVSNFVMHDYDLDPEMMQKRVYGGIVIFGKNIESAASLSAVINKLKTAPIVPFVISEEEGGSVSRVSQKLQLSNISSPSVIGKTGDVSEAYESGVTIADYLYNLGYNMNLGPMADLSISATNGELTDRCYSSDPAEVAVMTQQVMTGLQDHGIISVYKHFPGIGNADTETEENKVTVRTKRDKLYAQDILPFRSGIAGNASCVMVSSAYYEELDSDRPATFSNKIVNGILRDELNFDGVIISARLDSAVLKSNYSDWQIIILPIKAGCDMLYLPSDTVSAISTIVNAVENGEIA